jgi:hypothetical protein
MATRSMIGLSDGKAIVAIYCHYDGYPQHVGRILFENYDSVDKVQELLKLGNLSSLGKEIGEKQDFNNPTDRDWCLAYGRDRGERNQEAKSFHSLFYAANHFDHCDYFYVFEDNRWQFMRNGNKNLIPLEEEHIWSFLYNWINY